VIKPALGLGATNEENVARVLPDVHRLTGILDQQLRGKKFALGDDLTIADLTMACTLMYRVPAQVPLDDRPDVLRWIQSIEALDAWKNLPIRG
jgi:glutathione S-transferase